MPTGILEDPRDNDDIFEDPRTPVHPPGEIPSYAPGRVSAKSHPEVPVTPPSRPPQSGRGAADLAQRPGSEATWPPAPKREPEEPSPETRLEFSDLTDLEKRWISQLRILKQLEGVNVYDLLNQGRIEFYTFGPNRGLIETIVLHGTNASNLGCLRRLQKFSWLMLPARWKMLTRPESDRYLDENFPQGSEAEPLEQEPLALDAAEKRMILEWKTLRQIKGINAAAWPIGHRRTRIHTSGQKEGHVKELYLDNTYARAYTPVIQRLPFLEILITPKGNYLIGKAIYEEQNHDCISILPAEREILEELERNNPGISIDQLLMNGKIEFVRTDKGYAIGFIDFQGLEAKNLHCLLRLSSLQCVLLQGKPLYWNQIKAYIDSLPSASDKEGIVVDLSGMSPKPHPPPEKPGTLSQPPDVSPDLAPSPLPETPVVDEAFMGGTRERTERAAIRQFATTPPGLLEEQLAQGCIPELPPPAAYAVPPYHRQRLDTFPGLEPAPSLPTPPVQPLAPYHSSRPVSIRPKTPPEPPAQPAAPVPQEDPDRTLTVEPYPLFPEALRQMSRRKVLLTLVGAFGFALSAGLFYRSRSPSPRTVEGSPAAQKIPPLPPQATKSPKPAADFNKISLSPGKSPRRVTAPERTAEENVLKVRVKSQLVENGEHELDCSGGPCKATFVTRGGKLQMRRSTNDANIYFIKVRIRHTKTGQAWDRELRYDARTGTIDESIELPLK